MTARTKAIGDVPFKIIYLDECDALTREAQQALRRTMELYTSTARFILSCNYSSKIIEPIQSRCALFRFAPLPREQLLAIADRIAADEKLVLEKDAREALVIIADGDCRKMQNVLQAAAALDGPISAKALYAMAAVAEPSEIRDMVSLAMAGKFVEAREKLLSVMLTYGLSGLDVIKQVQKVVWKESLPPRTQVQLIDRCGEIEFRMVEGADEFVQLEALLASFWLAGQQK